MKTVLGVSLAILFFAASTPAQVLLNQGDVFTYEFTTLPSTIQPGSTGINALSFIPTFSEFQTLSDTIRIDAFENSLSENPWGSVFFSPAGQYSIGTGLHWLGDLQGVVKITVEQGSAVLETLRFFGEKPTDAGRIVYELQVTAVPEPGTISLACLGGGLALATYLRKRQRANRA